MDDFGNDLYEMLHRLPVDCIKRSAAFVCANEHDSHAGVWITEETLEWCGLLP